MRVVLTIETTTQRSVVVRPVWCEHCRRDYVYRDELVSQAQSYGLYGFGHTDVSRQLAADQNEKRKEEFTAVPCPTCFKYPEYMVLHLRVDRQAGRMVPGCLYLLGATGFAAAAWVVGAYTQWGFAVYLWVGAAVIGTLMAIYAISYARSLSYQPNHDRHLAERQAEAKESAMTREEFEERQRTDAVKSLADRLVAGRERPGYGQTPVQVPVWLGYCTDRDWWQRGELPTQMSVTLPTGEVFWFTLPDDAEEFDSFDLKRTVDDVRVVFRCVLRVYHPTQRVPR